MKKLNRLLSGVLALTMALFTVGCSGETQSAESGSESAVQTQAQTTGTGGYVEEDITPDENWNVGLFMLGDTLHYFSVENPAEPACRQKAHWYTMGPDGKWNERTDHGFEQAVSQLSKDARLSHPAVRLTQEGDLYWKFVTTDNTVDRVSTEYIFKVENGTATPVSEPPKGEVEIAFRYGMGMALCSGTIVTETNSVTLEAYNTSGEPLELELPAYTGGHILGGNQNGYYMWDNQNKIQHYVLGGTTAETVLDAGWYSLSDPEYSLSASVVGPDDTLYIQLSGSQLDEGLQKLLRYRWDPNAQTPSDDEALTVFSLYHSDTVDAAVNEMQKAHKVHVSYSYALEEIDGEIPQTVGSRSDALTQLNTQLLAGTGPDVIILDDMPVDSMIEKGVLKDLTGLVDTDGIFENMAAAYQTQDGLYAIPARSSPLLFAGDAKTVNAFESAEKLAEQLTQGPDIAEDYKIDNTRLLACRNQMDLFEVFYPLYASQIWQENSLNTEAFRDFAKMLGEIIQTTGQQLRESDAEHSSGSFYHTGNSTSSTYINAESLAYAERIHDIGLGSDFMCHAEIAKSANAGEARALTDAQGHSCIEPTCVAGINGSTQKPEQAAQFLQVLLGDAVQQADCYDGVPVRRTAAEKLWQRSMKRYKAKSKTDIAAVLEGMDVSKPSRLLYTAAAKGVLEYFKTDDLDSAVKIAQDSAKLWLAEQ